MLNCEPGPKVWAPQQTLSGRAWRANLWMLAARISWMHKSWVKWTKLGDKAHAREPQKHAWKKGSCTWSGERLVHPCASSQKTEDDREDVHVWNGSCKFSMNDKIFMKRCPKHSWKHVHPQKGLSFIHKNCSKRMDTRLLMMRPMIRKKVITRENRTETRDRKKTRLIRSLTKGSLSTRVTEI